MWTPGTGEGELPSVTEQMALQAVLLRHLHPLEATRRTKLPWDLLERYASLASRRLAHEIGDGNTDRDEQPLVVFAPTLLRGFFPTWFFARTEGHDPRSAMTRHEAAAVAVDWTRSIVRACLFVDQIWVPDPAELLVHHFQAEQRSRFRLGLHWPLLENPIVAIEALRAVQDLRTLAEAGVVRF